MELAVLFDPRDASNQRILIESRSNEFIDNFRTRCTEPSNELMMLIDKLCDKHNSKFIHSNTTTKIRQKPNYANIMKFNGISQKSVIGQ